MADEKIREIKFDYDESPFLKKIIEVKTGIHPTGVDVSKNGKEVWVSNYFPKC